MQRAGGNMPDRRFSWCARHTLGLDRRVVGLRAVLRVLGAFATSSAEFGAGRSRRKSFLYNDLRPIRGSLASWKRMRNGLLAVWLHSGALRAFVSDASASFESFFAHTPGARWSSSKETWRPITVAE